MTVTTIDEEALGWAIRTGDPAFEDWDGFTAWLEADPAHHSRYDAIAASLASAADIAASIPPTPAPRNAIDRPIPRAEYRPARRAYLRWSGGAIAAAVVGVIGFSLWSERPQPYVIATLAGQQRTVALTDGSEVVLAGGSRLQLDHASPRTASLDSGAALFRIRHDDSAPFSVRAGGMEVRDLGTVFDVAHDGGVTRVAVAEGLVMVDPGRAALRLEPGQAVRAEGGRIERQSIDPAGVGRWRQGILSFDDASLTEVAATLSRTLARKVSVLPAVAHRRFRGTLDATQIGDDPALLGRLLGVTVRRAGRDWRLEPLS